MVENRDFLYPHLYLAPPRRCLILVKLEWLGYRVVKKLWKNVKAVSIVYRNVMEERTELLYQYHVSVWWCAIKSRSAATRTNCFVKDRSRNSDAIPRALLKYMHGTLISCVCGLSDVERGLEHHELICEVHNVWTPVDEGRFYFRKDFSKYELFRNPTVSSKHDFNCFQLHWVHGGGAGKTTV